MTSSLEQAVEAHRRAESAAEQARLALASAIVSAARSGMKQVDIVRVTGYTREHVRQICRAAGVQPAR